MRDGYEIFFKHFNIDEDELISFGIQQVISADLNSAKTEWNSLKQKLENGSLIYIRDYGRKGTGSPLIKKFYSELFPKANIDFDRSGNGQAHKIIEKMTGLKKNSDTSNSIINFQVSHVFGRTKNPLCFLAPWNIVFIPKILDPFTGHEAKGQVVERFTQAFQTHVISLFHDQISEYNEIIIQHTATIDSTIQKWSLDPEQRKLCQDIKRELSPIDLKMFGKKAA